VYSFDLMMSNSLCSPGPPSDYNTFRWLVGARIKRSFLIMLVRYEQRALDIPGGDIKLLGEISNDHEKLIPVFEIKADPSRSLGHRSDSVEQLPHANVDDAISAGIEEHQNR
jgi:hypothetical protein